MGLISESFNPWLRDSRFCRERRRDSCLPRREKEKERENERDRGFNLVPLSLSLSQVFKTKRTRHAWLMEATVCSIPLNTEQ